MSKNSSSSGAERRKSRRRPVLESFALFAVVPKAGSHRLPVHDLSDDGMRLDLDADGEGPDNVAVAVGDLIDVHLYVNRSLYLPLTLKITRVETQDSVRRLGVQLQELTSPTSAAYGQFLKMLDLLAEVGHLRTG